MFIKVTDSLVVNTDRIAFINIGQNAAQLYEHFSYDLSKHDYLTVPVAAARYLLTLVEANTALTEIKPAPATLTSKIASALRDNYPNGATIPMLAVRFEAEKREVIQALVNLNDEKVIKVNDQDGTDYTQGEDGYALWYHVTNFPKAAPAETPNASLAAPRFDSREVFYSWDCKKCLHLQDTSVTSPGFLAGILYCKQCAEAHRVP